MSYTEDIETFTLKGLKDLASKLGAAQYGNKTDIAARIAAKSMGETMLQALFDKCKAEREAEREAERDAKHAPALKKYATVEVEAKLPDEFVNEYGMELVTENVSAEGVSTFTYVMKKGKKKIATGEKGSGTPTIKKKSSPIKKSSPTKKETKAETKKKDVVVVDDSDEESEDDEELIPFDAFAERLEQKIGGDRDLVNALIHKYDSVSMTTIKALSKKKAMKTLAELMCFEEEA